LLHFEVRIFDLRLKERMCNDGTHTNKQTNVYMLDICEGERTWQRDLYFINPPTSHGRPKDKFIPAPPRVRLTVACAPHTSCPSGRKRRRKSDQRKKITHISIPQAWLIVPAHDLEGSKGNLLIRLSYFECDRNYACNKEMDRL